MTGEKRDLGAARDGATDVRLSIEDGFKAYDLFTHVGDHGGGERYPTGDCPDEREAPCPSCDANRLAAVLKRALDATDDDAASDMAVDTGWIT